MEKGNIYRSTPANKSDADRLTKGNGSGIMKESEKHIYGDDSLRFLWLDLSRIAQSYSLSMYDPEPDLAFLKKFESEFLAGLEYNIF
jgi:hypothetical protein